MPDQRSSVPLWRPPRNTSFVYTSEAAAPQAARSLAGWWSGRSIPFADENRKTAHFTIALSRPELVTALARAASSGREDKPSIRRLPPNAKIDMRIATLVARLVGRIEQSHQVSVPTADGGIRFQTDEGASPAIGRDGLLRALADLEAAKPLVRHGRAFIPVHVRLEWPDGEALTGELVRNGTWLRMSADLEHCVRQTIIRLGSLQLGLTEADVRERPPTTVQAQLEEFETERERSWSDATKGVDASAGPQDEPGADRLACMVVARTDGERGSIEYTGWFSGDFREALKRVSAVLGFGYERMLFARRRRARWSSVLQEIVLAPVLTEFGALEEERKVLRHAVEVARRQRARGQTRKVIIGLVQINAGRLELKDHPWHRAELEAVLDFWGRPKQQRSRVRKIVCERPFRGTEMLPLDPHEMGRWRLERNGGGAP